MTQHKVPPFKTTQSGGSATGAVLSSNEGSLCSRAKTSAQGPKGREFRGSSQTELWTAQVLDRAEDVPTTGAKDAKVQKKVQVHSLNR